MPPGFGWAHHCAPAEGFFARSIPLCTLAQMRRALGDFEAIATRVFKRLPRDLREGLLVMTLTRKRARAAFDIAPAMEAAETS